MGIIYFLIGCSVLIAIIFLGAFFWANKSGQHDDTSTPAIRILFDDDPVSADDPSKTSSDKEKNKSDLNH